MCIITKTLKVSKTLLCHNKFIHPSLSNTCQVLVLLMVDCCPEVPIPGSKSSWNLHLLLVLMEDMAAGDLWPSGCWDICQNPPWPRLGLSRVRKWMVGGHWVELHFTFSTTSCTPLSLSVLLTKNTPHSSSLPPSTLTHVEGFLFLPLSYARTSIPCVQM